MGDLSFAAYRLDEPPPWQVRFEDERVRKVLEVFELLPRLRDLLADCEAETGARRLTFGSFRRVFPTFPILLAARYRGRVAEHCRPVSLFRRFGDVFLMQSYLEVFARSEEVARGRPVGLVVPFDGYKGGLVVHNGTYDTRGTKMIHAVAGDQPPGRVTVEPFVGLLRHLAAGGWTPDSPPPGRQVPQADLADREMAFTPRMVQELGCNSSLVVLAWLRKVLRSERACDRRFVRRLGAGVRSVKANHQEIASETGLSERQVKRGLEGLRQTGALLPASQVPRGCIVLAPAAPEEW